MMRVLGIDPGFKISGFAIMNRQECKSFLLDYGALKMDSSLSISSRIGKFYDFFSNKISTYSVSAIALETPYLGKNAQNFLKLGYLRGILYLLADINNLKIFEFAPKEIKLSLTGYGTADKEQVARVILRLFPNMNMPDKLDITDALAVTICGLFRSSILL